MASGPNYTGDMIRVHDPVVESTGDQHLFALSVRSVDAYGGSAAADAGLECTLADAPQTARAVWRALLGRAPEFFDQTMQTEADVAAHFPVSLEVAIAKLLAEQPQQPQEGGGGGTAARWRIRGLLFTDGAFLWSLAPPPAKLKLRIAAGTKISSNSAAPPRKYRNTPMVRRSMQLPSDDEQPKEGGEEEGGQLQQQQQQQQEEEEEQAARRRKHRHRSPPPTDILEMAEAEAAADDYYHEYVAAVEHSRQIRLKASRRFLERSGIRHASDYTAADATP